MTKPHDGGAGRPQRLVLSSDELPAELDDEARMRRWQEIREGISGAFEDTRADDRPFSARLEVARFGSAVLVEFSDTLVRTARSARYIAADGSDNFLLAINAGREPLLQRQRGREAMLAPGALTLFSNADAGEVHCAPGSIRRLIMVSRKRLADLIPAADDHVARMVAPSLPAARLLRRYLDILLGPDGVEDDPLLADHVATTLLDLIGLALGAGRDAAEVATKRGLRAARLQAVLAQINGGFAHEGFSVRHVGRRLGVSPRYVQNLLGETGATFSERVLELRLRKAHAMLARPSGAAMSVSTIAFACGFSEASYFNRRFRRRYGLTPSQARGAV
jgi:AraC-like DNA-binding protein